MIPQTPPTRHRMKAQAIPSQPIAGAAVWGKSATLRSLDAGRHREELMHALAAAKLAGLTLEDGWQPNMLTVAQFPLPKLAPKLRKLRRALRGGQGAAVIYNLPVDGFSDQELELFTENVPSSITAEERRSLLSKRLAGVVYAGINAHIGQWAPQEEPDGPDGEPYLAGGGALHCSEAGTLRLKDYRPPKEPPEKDGSIQLHCDAPSRCDVVTMLLLAKPSAGGKPRLASAATVFNELLKVEPMLACRLQRPSAYMHNPDDPSSGVGVCPIFTLHDDGRLTSHLVSKKRFGVAMSARMRERLAPSTREQMALNDDLGPGERRLVDMLNLIEEIAVRHAVTFDMEVGMAYYAN